MTEEDKRTEILDLSWYLFGVADVSNNRLRDKLEDAAVALRRAAANMCSKGYYGCTGRGHITCTSDHK